MKLVLVIVTTIAILPVRAPDDENAINPQEQWPQWRGPLGTGVAPHGKPPVTWGEDQNIRWKIPVPGKGHSTPIVWGDRIFITTAVPHGEPLPVPKHDHEQGAHNNMPPSRRLRFVVLAIDRRNGALLWKQTVRDQQPREGTHETGTWASNSAVTDGRHVFAHFGSHGLYCLDMNGKLLWETDLGDMQTRHAHGEGSSPALYGDTLVVNWDHQGDSFVVALDKHTGKLRWKTPRDEITSWSTPLIVEHKSKHQIVIAATKRVRGYELATGKVIWECAGLSRNVVASPVAADGWVYVAGSYDWQAMLAIRLDAARGDITNTDAVAWKLNRHTPYVPSLLLYDNHIYFLKHNQGYVTCAHAKTGKPLFGPQRLGLGNVFASPVGAANRVYIVDRNGTTVVMKHGDKFNLLARNRLDDSFSASPAVVGNALYLRGERNLYCIAE